MAELIRMPEVLAGATEAAIQTWLVEPGAAVALSQPIAEIETDKATVELTAEVAGTIGRLLAGEGDNVAVGEPILVMLLDGEGETAIEAALGSGGQPAVTPVPAAPEPETAPEPEPEKAPTAPAPQTAPVASATPAAPVSAAPSSDGRRLFASPLVRRIAAEEGVDIGDVRGSGPNGRVVRRDLERHLADRHEDATETASEVVAVPANVPPPAVAPASSPADAAAFEDVPLDRMRRTIARRLTESKSTVPHFYLTADCRIDDLLALRAQVNAGAPRKVSLNDFVLKAVAGALIEVPDANAIWNGDSIRRFHTVDISVAVAIDGGLTTPVVRAVERLPLTELSATVADLAERGRASRLKQHELEGGSFSVSNLGMYGTTEFSAILNPPQSGILAVGAARPQPIVTADGELAVGTVMTVTLSADHRVLDGAVAAQWLAAFQRRIENPLTILI